MNMIDSGQKGDHTSYATSFGESNIIVSASYVTVSVGEASHVVTAHMHQKAKEVTMTLNDKEILLAILEEISKSMTGAQSTKHWAENAVWFDIPPFASKGIPPALRKFDEAFGQLKSIDVEIMETEIFINGNMGVVCSIQRWSMEMKSGETPPPLFVRQTNCFEKQNGEWKIIHEHSSIPSAPGWEGTFITH